MLINPKYDDLHSEIKEHIMKSWNELIHEFNISTNLNICSKGIYGLLVCKHKSDFENIVKEFYRGSSMIEEAVTFSNLSLSDDPAKNPPNDINIIGVEHIVILPEEIVLARMIDYEFDFNKIISYFKLILRHEIGHIIHNQNTYIGMNLQDWNEMCLKVNEEVEAVVSKEYKSYEDLLKTYNNISEEKYANEAVGITVNDFINIYHF